MKLDTNTCKTEEEAADCSTNAQLSDGDLKVKINTFIWENAPGEWTLNLADEVACKMVEAFLYGEQTLTELRP